MHRHFMLEALCWAAIVLLTAAGCCTPITSHQFTATPTARPDTSKLHAGDYCKIETQLSPEANPSCYHVYSGTVAGITADEIVLKNVVDESSIEYGMPVIDDIPFLNVLLKRERIGHIELATVRLSLDEIKALEVCDPPAAPKNGKREPGA